MNIESQILNIPIEDIIPNRFQPRLSFDDSSLQELAQSIKQHGIIQPLVLRKMGDKYEIIAGERRYKASTMAGLTSVPAIISQLDDRKSAEVAIVENIQRRDLSSIEEAISYKALLDKGYLTQEELAKKMGISQSAISNKLRLLSLSKEVQDALMDGKISERHARSLLQLNNHEDQNQWLSKIINERLTVKDLENMLKGKVNEEVPIININPNMNDIINNSTDIINRDIPSNVENIEDLSETPMINKFFNPLESESINMKNNEVPKEEIEILDFITPILNINDQYERSIQNIKQEVEKVKQSYPYIIIKEETFDTEFHLNITIKKN